MRHKIIKTLKELKKELDKLYKGVYKFCKNCQEEDCKGMVWLLPGELKNLLQKNIPLIEINRKLNFIDSFSKKNWLINIEEKKPSCILRKQNKKCYIYKIRPLICRLYPIDFKVIKKQIYIVLHIDCLFIKKLIKKKKINQFIEKIIFLFYNLHQGLLKTMLNEYKSVNSISKYPTDYKHNDYIKILKVIIKRNKIKNMSKCVAVLNSKKVKEIRVKGKPKKAKK